MDFSQFNEADTQRMQQLLERNQMRDFMRLYSGLVQRCFDSCVTDFTSKTMSTKEEGCVSRCTDKFMKHAERVGQRFAEQNSALMEEQSKK
ncbi:protein transporter tim9 [Tieghemiomyces parasiticus]|uniref:Mitochondrial import inner membrane translocase subunit n=1 Tax=Tieghemiomyces parasiticus TaxID=78921 RepID=A0A9W8AEH8_9FUNG|nr:protein transporter tim9 [Tieghemiomyces parasiticus]KAJ1926609.1 protein transporter tim9 [Tieghemiomyces parasiticus]